MNLYWVDNTHHNGDIDLFSEPRGLGACVGYVRPLRSGRIWAGRVWREDRQRFDEIGTFEDLDDAKAMVVMELRMS
jgi:hypothetical protein